MKTTGVRFYRLAQGNRKTETTSAAISHNDVFEARFVCRDLSVSKPLDLLYIYVDAGYMVAEISEARSADEAYIARSDNADVVH